MPVSLIIEEARHDTKVVTIPDGATVTVRRTDAGADVLVLPASEAKTGPVEAAADGAPNGSGRFAASVADAIGQAGSSKSAFPLDAEQIVRLAGSILTQVLNANRHPDAKTVRVDDTIIALGAATGVPLSVDESGFHARLLPYGEKISASTCVSDQQVEGGPRGA